MSKRAVSHELEQDPTITRRFFHLKISFGQDFALVQDFALSILKDRKLAQYVRHLTLEYNEWSSFPTHERSYTATTEAELERVATFKAAIAERKWEEGEATELLARLMTIHWQGVNSSHQLFPDAVVALLLPILPKVQKWTVGDLNRSGYVGKALQRAQDGIFGSISITHVELFADAEYSDAAWASYSFPGFEIFGMLPSLKCIKGKGIGGIRIEDGGTYHEIPSRVSSVREIYLKECELSVSCISKIINFSTGLEAFMYRFGGRTGDGSFATMYLPELAKALNPHRSTLRSLEIDLDTTLYQSFEEETGAYESMLKREDKWDSDAESSESAKGKASAGEEATKKGPYFPHLTHLRIGIKLAWRFAELSGMKTLAEWVPASLVELEFVGYDPQESDFITKQVTEVFQRREKLLPKLKVLNGVEEFIENGK